MNVECKLVDKQELAYLKQLVNIALHANWQEDTDECDTALLEVETRLKQL